MMIYDYHKMILNDDANRGGALSERPNHQFSFSSQNKKILALVLILMLIILMLIVSKKLWWKKNTELEVNVRPSILILSLEPEYLSINFDIDFFYIDAHNLDAHCIKQVMMKRNVELQVNVRPSILILSLEQEYLGQKMSFWQNIVCHTPSHCIDNYFMHPKNQQ